MLRPLLFACLLASLAPAASAQPSQARAERLFIGALADLYAGNPARAAVRLGDVLAVYPEDPTVLDALAEAYQAQGMTPEALFHAEQAARLAPDNDAIRRRLEALRVTAGASPSPDGARRTPPAASRAEPPGADPTVDSTGTLPGEDDYRAGRYGVAADALLGVVEADPRQIRAWAMALDALARARDPRASDTADLAVLLYPALPSVLAPAAEAFQAAGQPAKARETATAALQALDAGEDDPALRARLDALLSSLD